MARPWIRRLIAWFSYADTILGWAARLAVIFPAFAGGALGAVFAGVSGGVAGVVLGVCVTGLIIQELVLHRPGLGVRPATTKNGETAFLRVKNFGPDSSMVVRVRAQDGGSALTWEAGWDDHETRGARFGAGNTVLAWLGRVALDGQIDFWTTDSPTPHPRVPVLPARTISMAVEIIMNPSLGRPWRKSYLLHTWGDSTLTLEESPE